MQEKSHEIKPDFSWKLKTRRTWSNALKLKQNYQPRLLYSVESSAIVEEERHFT